MKTDILKVKFDVITKSETIKKIIKYLKTNKNHLIFTPNPEMALEATKDDGFLNILNSADILIPDGIGIVIASYLNKIKLKERVAGCDIAYGILHVIKNSNYKVYLLGGKEGITKQAKANLEKEYNVKIINGRDGYFKDSEDREIVEHINQSNVDILFVGLGFPRQEKWLYKYKDQLNVKVSMGVGGTLDVMSGNVKRAPKIYQKIGMEWFYRLLKQPKRIGRIVKLPVFIFKVITNKFLRSS